MSEYGCPMNNSQDCRQMDITFSLQGILRGPLSESHCSFFFLLNLDQPSQDINILEGWHG